MINMFYNLQKLAENNKLGFPFSACIVINKKYYYAVNEVLSKKDPTAHAEIQAIRLACKKEKNINLLGSKIYCSGEPCPMCLTAIAWAEIKNIYYINSYKRAKLNNEYYNQSSKKVNRFLKLKRKINKII